MGLTKDWEEGHFFSRIPDIAVLDERSLLISVRSCYRNSKNEGSLHYCDLIGSNTLCERFGQWESSENSFHASRWRPTRASGLEVRWRDSLCRNCRLVWEQDYCQLVTPKQIEMRAARIRSQWTFGERLSRRMLDEPRHSYGAMKLVVHRKNLEETRLADHPYWGTEFVNE